jgi:hypothetical protein
MGKTSELTQPEIVSSRDMMTPPETGPSRNALHQLDQLEYLADLVCELRSMALTAGLQTTTQLLAVAHFEVLQQIAARRRD